LTFTDKLGAAMARNDSLLCVGLDPDPGKMPVRDVVAFNRAVIDATADLVCCYKPNFAFYEQFGPAGMEALAATIQAVPAGIPVIGDAKRGDIGNTAQAYARAVFEVFGCDAVTASPLLGRDSLEPFLAYHERTTFVLCRTSNPGARDLQDLHVNGEALYEVIARRAREWNQQANVGLVVGATYPAELARVRALCPDQVVLVPAIGAQGGDLEASVRAGVNREGFGVIFSASRQVLYAGTGGDFALAARRVAMELRSQINSARAARGARSPVV
jgi:orotidine-5'-phosphate decarboxylase